MGTVFVASAGATPLDPVTGNAEAFFGLSKVYTFHLTIAAADFRKMPPPNGRGGRGRGGGRGVAGMFDGDSGYTRVPATLQFEGKDWGPLTVRYKGNSSYRGAPSELKRSLKLDFDVPDKTRMFFGLPKLNLNNNAFDSSQMRETLAYDVFRRAGVVAPRTAFAKVFITVPGQYHRQYAGLFTVVEQIDQTFFKDRWGKKVGVLVKPEGLRGLPYLGDDWTSYKAPYASKGTAKAGATARFIAFVTFLNQASDEEFARRIGEYLDVEAFLRFLAAEVVLVNTDSPLAMNHNYWLTIQPDTQKVVWVPWDMNMAFGGFGGGDPDLSLRQPSAPGMFPLADRLLAIPGVVQRYDQIVREMATANFTASRLGTQMQVLAAAIHDAVATDSTTTVASFERNLAENPSVIPAAVQGNTGGPGGPGGFPGRGGFGWGGRNAPPLRQFVTARIESVVEQLDGTRQGTTGRAGRGGFGGPVGGLDAGRPRRPFNVPIRRTDIRARWFVGLAAIANTLAGSGAPSHAVFDTGVPTLREVVIGGLILGLAFGGAVLFPVMLALYAAFTWHGKWRQAATLPAIGVLLVGVCVVVFARVTGAAPTLWFLWLIPLSIVVVAYDIVLVVRHRHEIGDRGVM